jgi:putative transposase
MQVRPRSAIARNGKPEILNSDQGCRYTRAIWTPYPEDRGIQISMDGKGRALDHVWIERFWTSLLYDYVYLNPAYGRFELNKGVQKPDRLRLKDLVSNSSIIEQNVRR